MFTLLNSNLFLSFSQYRFKIPMMKIALICCFLYSQISFSKTYTEDGNLIFYKSADLIFSNDFEIQQNKNITAYFTEWGVYARNYHVKNIVSSNSAEKLTHILYAFGNVSNGQCVVGDSYAAYDKYYSSTQSVDGIADSWDAGALRGNFNQLLKLKQQYPNIKILWSFGGWTWSNGFAQAAANPQVFADSCYDLIHDSRWDGLFDGIDIDWEYPNACGLSCDTSGFDAYRILMQSLKTRFGSELVTAAIVADSAKLNAADYAGASQYIDFYYVMTYDFFGAWSANGPTAPHSPLTSFQAIPQADSYSDAAIQLLLSKGISSTKLNLGIGFYGRGWSGVSQSLPGGTATGAASGVYETGINDYKVLKTSCPSTAQFAGTAYAHCGNEWWSYDTPQSIEVKMNYVTANNLAGSFIWELSGDTLDGELIQAIFGQ